MTDRIRGDVEGLRAMAATCQLQAAALNASAATPLEGPAFQATSRVVAGVHQKAHVAERAIIVRITATAEKATAAAATYEVVEQNSSSALKAVT